MKFNKSFEEYFVPSSYNCRKKKGVLYGVNDINEKMVKITNKNQFEAWILKCDLQSFFMGIDKVLLCKMLEDFLRNVYKRDDIEDWIWLIKKIVMHEPQNKRIVKGNKDLLRQLPFGKTLDKNDPYHGLAIGNLPSQIFANFLLSLLDYLLYYWSGVEYGRYVDDFIAMHRSKKELLYILNFIRRFVDKYCHVRLHPDKVYIQPVRHGVVFTGYGIKQGRIYIGKRTLNNVFKIVENGHSKNIERFVKRLNSYLGFMQHTNSYGLRIELWKKIPDNTIKMLYCKDDFKTIKIIKKYQRVHQSVNFLIK